MSILNLINVCTITLLKVTFVKKKEKVHYLVESNFFEREFLQDWNWRKTESRKLRGWLETVYCSFYFIANKKKSVLRIRLEHYNCINNSFFLWFPSAFMWILIQVSLCDFMYLKIVLIWPRGQSSTRATPGSRAQPRHTPGEPVPRAGWGFPCPSSNRIGGRGSLPRVTGSP